jgi:hypothetical protein
MPLLSVAIPTFNRHDFLRATLQALRPQARENIELVVVDNCSTPPVEAVVREVLGGSDWSFRVIRNAANVGLCANILRCFEVAEGEWLWVLSDDDLVKPDAVMTLFQTLTHHPDLLFATYSLSACPIDKETIYETVDSFILALPSVWIAFISSALYQRRELLRHLYLAYNFIDSGAPHTALLLLEGLAGTKRKLAYLTQELVTWQPPVEEQRYSQFTCIGFLKLLTLCDGGVRRRLAAVFQTIIPPPQRLLTHLLRDAERGRSRASLSTTLDQYLDSYSLLVGGIKAALWRGPLRLLFHFFLRFPTPAWRVLNTAAKLLRGRELVLERASVSLNSYERTSNTERQK